MNTYMGEYINKCLTSKNIIFFGGTSGIASLFYLINAHYKRLNSNKVKQIEAGSIDNTSETLSKTEEKKVNEEITELTLEKISEKIKNSIIHTVCICIDKMQGGKKAKINNRPNLNASLVINQTDSKILNENADEIIIQDVVVDDSEKKKADYQGNTKELAEIISNIETKSNFLPEFEKGLFAYNNIRQGEGVLSSYQVLDYLIETEKSIISSFKLTVKDYQDRIKKLIPTNKKIKDSILILNLYMQGLETKEIFDIQFSPKLVNNYIKIISNIYYINITKAASKFKKEIIDANKVPDSHSNEPLLEKLFNDMYKDSLKETRNEVAEFFGITSHEVFDLPVKTMFRIYPYYLDQDSDIRKQYYALTDTVNKLIKYLERKVLVPQFIDEKHADYNLKPRDMTYDFNDIIATINSEEGDVYKENKELLNQFKRKYKEEEPEDFE